MSTHETDTQRARLIIRIGNTRHAGPWMELPESVWHQALGSLLLLGFTGEREADWHGERAERQDGAVSPTACDCSETTRGPGGPLLEQHLIDRVNALEKLAEELIEVLDSEGYLYAAVWRARLRDRGEDE